MTDASSDLLKLIALDGADLAVISAHVQDATVRADALDYDSRAGRLLIAMNRFAWEAPGIRKLFRKQFQRRNAVLHIDRVQAVQRRGMPAPDSGTVLALLSITFTPTRDDGQGASPEGVVELTFSGDAGLRVTVEALEVRSTDLGAAWAAGARPRHV